MHGWSRKPLLESEPLASHEDDTVFVKWDDWFSRQIRWGFQQKQVSKKEREARLGLGLRSTNNDDMFIDEDAVHMETTKHCRLSRMHWEDLLDVVEGESFALYFCKDTSML